MKIDWKYVASTDGYKSLKVCYIHDIKNSWRSKKESLENFQWVISRAKHFAHHNGKSIEQILDEWEEKRTCWWLGFYKPSVQPKFHSNSLKPCKKYRQIEKLTKIKPRWSTARKKRGY